jgi:hypothetical protein
MLVNLLIRLMTVRASILKLVTLWRMPRRQKAFFFINWILCGIARAVVKALPFRWYAYYLGQRHPKTILSTVISKSQMQHARQISRSIKLAAKYTPWTSNCLPQAMVAAFWCQRYHIPYILFIGFNPSSLKTNGFDGHAWVTAGPIAITGGDSFHSHHVILSYSYRDLLIYT